MKARFRFCLIERPVHILILGAYGFIGCEIARSLSEEHRVSGFGRDIGYGKRLLPQLKWVSGDLKNFTSPEIWLPLLIDVDVVINASGILQGGPSDSVEASQGDAIIALIEACEASSIKQFIQISAVGSEANARSDFLTSKAKSDQRLRQTTIPFLILRPGLVIGRNSYGGTELIRSIAAFPAVQPTVSALASVQTIGLADLVEAVKHGLSNPAKFCGSFDLVEEQSRSLTEIVSAHRNWLGVGSARFAPSLPLWALHLVSRVADVLGWFGWRSPLRRNAVLTLIVGVSGNAAEALPLLGRPAAPLEKVLAELPSGKQDRWHARLNLLLPIMLVSLVLLWLGSGILGLARTDVATLILTERGMPKGFASFCVMAGSVVDVVIGLSLMVRRTVQPALLAVVLMTLLYWVGAALFAFDLWLDPLAPMLKTVPATMLALGCYAMLDKR
jgi:uncharacterized protein YbjT (DUF2867 family)